MFKNWTRKQLDERLQCLSILNKVTKENLTIDEWEREYGIDLTKTMRWQDYSKGLKILKQKKMKNLVNGSSKIRRMNKERNRKGLPLVYENYQQETKLKHYLRQKFPNFNIFWNKRLEELDGLELDIYIPKYNLAVEYNGKQHYKFIPFFHKTKEDFRKQLERDRRKKELCKRWNISLIVVPYYMEDVESYINKKLTEIAL